LLNVTSRRKRNTMVIDSHFFINATFHHWSLIKKTSPPFLLHVFSELLKYIVMTEEIRSRTT
jgi:hypothetical protein